MGSLDSSLGGGIHEVKWPDNFNRRDLCESGSAKEDAVSIGGVSRESQVAADRVATEIHPLGKIVFAMDLHVPAWGRGTYLEIQ
jgi:hypothetical protein